MSHVLIAYVGAIGFGEFTSFARLAFGRSATAVFPHQTEQAPVDRLGCKIACITYREAETPSCRSVCDPSPFLPYCWIYPQVH